MNREEDAEHVQGFRRKHGIKTTTSFNRKMEKELRNRATQRPTPIFKTIKKEEE